MLTLWKSLVLPHIDYCCQLWTPDRKGHIQALEAIQKSFLRKITGYSQLNYWQLLDTLNIKSIQRRQERYSIIYTWRMMENQVPNAGIQHHISKRGRRCVVPPLTSARDNWIRRLRESSLNSRGPTLFNCLPRNIREITNCKTESFKSALDTWLKSVPDEPQIPGYTAMRRSESNSLRHMLVCVKRDSETVQRSIDSTPPIPSQLEAACRSDLGGL